MKPIELRDIPVEQAKHEVRGALMASSDEPSFGDLADRLRLDLSTVVIAVKELRDAGEIDDLNKLKKKDKPKRRMDIDWSDVISQCEDHIALLYSGGYHPDDDGEHYLYEAVMEAVFGEDIWDWIRLKH